MQYHKRVARYVGKLTDRIKQLGLKRVGLYGSFLLIGVSSLVHWLEWLPILCLVPIFIYVEDMDRRSKREIARDFYTGGILVNGFAFLFLLQIKANNWAISLPNWVAIIGSVVAFSIVVAVCSLPLILIGLALQRIRKIPYRLLLVLVLLPIYEIVRSYGVAILSYGPGNSISPNFNFGSLGSIVAGTPLVYAARITGLFGLSCLVLIANLAVFYFFYKRKRLVGAALAVSIIALTTTGWLIGRTESKQSMKVAVVHVHEEALLDTWKDWHNLPNNLDLLVLPEYSDILKHPDIAKIAGKLNKNGLGITSTIYQENGRTYNQLQYFDSHGKVVNKQNKTFIIPTGESMPYILRGVFYAIGQKELVKQFSVNQQITPGDKPELPFIYGDKAFGGLICSGAVALNEYPRLAKAHADVLINAASLSFLTRTSVYHTHARNMARYHAVVTRKPFIQASRSGQSFIMTSQGQRTQTYGSPDTTIISGSVNY